MAIQMANIEDFPSQQAEAIQKQLLELDEQGNLLDYFKEKYQDLGKYNSLARYIKDNWETGGKELFIEWTGIETFSDKHTISAIGIKMNEVSYGSSNRYFLWKCNVCQHEWVAKPNQRTGIKSDCPECAKIKMAEAAHLKGETLEHWCNRHETYGAKLKSEFIGKLWNGTFINIEEVSKGSHIKVWWKCSNPDCGYEWVSTPAHRTNINTQRGCPACGKNICVQGKNDLETYCHQHPELNYILEEFTGLDKNNQPIKPSEVARASTKKIWFGCNKCHKRWLATIRDRTFNKSGCPYCTPKGTSFPEQYIYHSLLQLFPNTKNRQKDKINNYEYDIVIPELNLCIEYSGYYYHQDKVSRDKVKADHCKSNGAQFLQIYAHNGEIKDTDEKPAQDTYTKSQIVYKQAVNSKPKHIIQLQQIIQFILEQYAPNHSIKEINFQKSEDEANKVIGKA